MKTHEEERQQNTQDQNGSLRVYPDVIQKKIPNCPENSGKQCQKHDVYHQEPGSTLYPSLNMEKPVLTYGYSQGNGNRENKEEYHVDDKDPVNNRNEGQPHGKNNQGPHYQSKYGKTRSGSKHDQAYLPLLKLNGCTAVVSYQLAVAQADKKSVKNKRGNHGLVVVSYYKAVYCKNRQKDQHVMEQLMFSVNRVPSWKEQLQLEPERGTE